MIHSFLLLLLFFVFCLLVCFLFVCFLFFGLSFFCTVWFAIGVQWAWNKAVTSRRFASEWLPTVTPDLWEVFEGHTIVGYGWSLGGALLVLHLTSCCNLVVILYLSNSPPVEIAPPYSIDTSPFSEAVLLSTVGYWLWWQLYTCLFHFILLLHVGIWLRRCLGACSRFSMRITLKM